MGRLGSTCVVTVLSAAIHINDHSVKLLNLTSTDNGSTKTTIARMRFSLMLENDCAKESGLPPLTIIASKGHSIIGPKYD